jgi:hypothetical protein
VKSPLSSTGPPIHGINCGLVIGASSLLFF